MEEVKLHNDFLTSLGGLLPSSECQALVNALGQSPEVSVRLNTGKGGTLAAEAAPVPWCPVGCYLDRREAFTFDPHFHAGRYYVQDASSMFLHHVIKQLVKEPVAWLDLCAAPGGKTTTAIDALPAGSLVVANEVVPGRALVLRDNVMKWGNASVAVTRATPAAMGKAGAMFDVVATDVPCSGEGMMRKDDEAVAQWSPALVRQCAERQRSILADVWPALKPGGLLVYSTCTFNRHENEEMIDYLVTALGAEPVAVPVEPQWNIAAGIDTPYPCYRFMPHRTRGEGLFVAVVRKRTEAVARTAVKKAGLPAVPRDLARWLAAPEDCVAVTQADVVSAVPARWASLVATLLKKVPVLLAGVELAVMKGRKMVPSHGLALSTALNPGAFPAVELDYAGALAYLRGEAISVEAPRGYVAVTYQGSVLGFVNNLGARANNLYPKQLRILSTHAPATAPAVLAAL